MPAEHALTHAPTRPSFVITGAALGSLFEWYDFFLYGSLATGIARHFLAGVNEAASFILAPAGRMSHESEPPPPRPQSNAHSSIFAAAIRWRSRCCNANGRHP